MRKYVTGLVSVVIPTYKRSDALPIAIDSVLGQTYTNVEVLVVNDNIPGDEYSKELIKLMDRYSSEARVKLVEQERHINGAAARNAGIRKARGEYISFLDDDDFFSPNKVEEQINVFQGLSEDYGMVSCLNKIFKNGELINVSVPYKDGDMLMPVLCRKVGIGTGSVLIRRETLDNAGYFDENLMRHQDLQLFACICGKYKVKLLRKYLHNIEIGDAQNRPDHTKLITIKKAFFESISDIMSKLSAKEQNRVHIMHELEFASAYKKAGQKKKCIKKILIVFSTPWTAWCAMYRICTRIVGQKLKKHYVKRYN